MSDWDHTQDGTQSRRQFQGDIISMRKLMSLMLGLSLLTGVATVAFGQDDKKDDTTKKKKKKKGADDDKK
jgi:hypothetical protein